MDRGSVRRRGLAIVVGAVVAISACSDGSGSSLGHRSRELGPTFDVDGVKVERTHVGPEGLVHDVAVFGDTVVALASPGAANSANLLLYSGDAGITWNQGSVGFTSGGSRNGSGSPWVIGPEYPELLVAGSTVFASRTWSPQEVDPTAARMRQELRVSVDQGVSWQSVELPVGEDEDALVSAAATINGTVVLVGTAQHNHSDGSATGNLSEDLEAYDGAAWVSSDGGRTFERSDGAAMSGRPGMQIIREVVEVDQRLVALGWDTSLRVRQECCFPSWGLMSLGSDDGQTWTDLPGIDDSIHPMDRTTPRLKARLVEDSLELGDVRQPIRLSARSDQWETASEPPLLDNPLGFDLSAAVVTVDEQTFAGTWVEAIACDCEVAWGGRVDLADQPGASATRLVFDDCVDTSVRGQTGIAAPHRLGVTVAAFAWCNDTGLFAGALATSTDQGRAWDTSRLAELAPSGWSDLQVSSQVYPEKSAASGDEFMIIGLVAGTSARPDVMSAVPPAPGPIVILRITQG